MSEFGGRSELGRQREIKPVTSETAEVPTLKRRLDILSALATRPIEVKKPHPDPLKECAGESDLAVFSVTPFAKPPQPVRSITAQLEGRDWSRDLLMPDGARAGASTTPAEDLLKE